MNLRLGCTLGELYIRAIKRYSSNVAVADEHQSLTYKEFGEKCGIPIKTARFSDSDGTFNCDNEYLTIINTAAVKRMDLLDYYDRTDKVYDKVYDTVSLWFVVNNEVSFSYNK